jgi:flagella basal body P-ring formation protein FlgA
MNPQRNPLEITGRHLVYFVAGACAALGVLAASAARSQTAPVRLKPIVTVEADVVRLSDLIDGASADIAVFGAPAPGGTGQISTARIVAAAREHGVNGVETSGLTTITVRRAGRRVTADEISQAVTAALIAEHQLNADAEVELNAGQLEATVESSATQPLVIRNLSYNGASGRFEATYVVPGSRALELNPGRIVGSIADIRRVPVLTRPILKGDVVSAADIVLERRRRSDLSGDVFVDPAKIVGNAARRPLPRGTLLREADLQRPEVVEKNAGVTMTYDGPGLQLTMRGKALAGGAVGDIIQVQNVTSKRTVEAAVTGPNRVAVTGTVLPQKTARNGAAIQ